MPVFFLADIHVHDPDAYARYVEEATPIVTEHGGRYVFRTDSAEPVTGGWDPQRLVCIEFPTRDAMQACFSSDNYLSIKHLREQSTSSRAVCFEGSVTGTFEIADSTDSDGSVTVRSFQETDRQAVVELWRECGLVVPWNDPDRDISRKLAVQPELFLIATDGRRLVGSAMVGYEGHRGWVNYLAVAHTHRGQGLGRRLMTEAEARLKAMGCPKINLLVRGTNTSVLGFYQRLGYRQDDCLSLGKRLITDN